MINYPQQLKLLLPLLLCSGWALGRAREDSEPLQRSKRALTTICVEIPPTGLQNEPYFMCKGADFSYGAAPTQTAAPVPVPAQAPAPTPVPAPAPAPPAAHLDQSNYNYAQTVPQLTPAVPFSSFPNFGPGFFPASQTYEKSPPASSSPASPGATYAPLAPASAPQSYGLPAVSYPAPGGTAAALRGTSGGSGPAATPTAYVDARTAKPSPAELPARQADSRHRVALDESVLAVPNVGFQPEELNPQYRRPVNSVEPPHPYYDDPIMRTFYASLGHQEPQVAQAASLGKEAAVEPLVSQVVPAYNDVPPPPAPPVPPGPPALPSAPSYSPPLDGNACNSCNRPCSTSADNCPSFQPVIIAMPCYGQQQPTHYLAVPGSSAPGAAPLSRDSYGSGYAMAPQVGSPLGGHFGGMSGVSYGLSPPQVGAPFGSMGPQVGGPFGMPPVLNPFGPFGTLNPFNPFNRILGAPAQNTAMPRMRLFNAPDIYSTTTTTAPQSPPAVPQIPQQSTASSFKLNFSTSTLAPPTRQSTETTGGNAQNEEREEKEDEEEMDDEEDTDTSLGATQQPQEGQTTAADASAEDDDDVKDQTFDELVKKGEDKIKSDKRKRQNSRSSNSKSQKRKYLQRL